MRLRRRPPLVLFTAWPGQAARRATPKGSLFAYLAKPIHQSQLDAGRAARSLRDGGTGEAAARLEMATRQFAAHPPRRDNVVNQNTAVRILEQMGYRADLASNGIDAIESVERQTYDVLMDAD